MTEQRDIWIRGFVAGLHEYAWWKDGIQYVGSCGTTLAQAIERAEREYGGKAANAAEMPSEEECLLMGERGLAMLAGHDAAQAAESE